MWFIGIPFPRPATLAARLETPVEEWPDRPSDVLLKTRSRKVGITCHSSDATPAPAVFRCSPAAAIQAGWLQLM